MIRIRWALSLNSTDVRFSFPKRSTYTSLGVVTRISGGRFPKNARKFSTSAVAVLAIMNIAGASANQTGRPVRQSQTLTPTSVRAARS